MEKRPGADAVLSGHEMTMKSMSSKEETVHVVHVTVDHVAGAVGIREVIGDDKGVGLEAELENSVQRNTIG